MHAELMLVGTAKCWTPVLRPSEPGLELRKLGRKEAKAAEAEEGRSSLVSSGGMGVVTTALFIVGEMAGGGIVAMPKALMLSGWSGLGTILVGALTSAYTGIQLGWSWTILQENWQEYRDHTRKPYPEIARRALGDWAKVLTSVFITVSLFGVCVVFLLLSSTIIAGLISSFGGESISFCYLILIMAAILLPVTMLKSPKDFWPAIVLAMVTTTVATIFVLIATISEKDKASAATYPETNARNWFLSFATIIFAYGGHAAFPTIQHDMRRPSLFPRSVILAYLMIICYYIPVSVAAYVVYGGALEDNVLGNVAGVRWAFLGSTLLICLHVLLSFIIISNPVNQEIEELLHLPQGFCWQRVVSRTTVMLAVVFCAETEPHFGNVLNLIAGSTTTFLTFVFPPIFFLALERKYRHGVGALGKDGKKASSTSIWIILINLVIIAVGGVGGVASTYAAVDSMLHPPGNRTFSVPCYVNMTAAFF